MTTPPLIAVTMGDPAGVGPEILAKTFAEADYREGNRVVVVGDAGTILTSSEGDAAWTTQSSGVDVDLRGVGWGDGLYVAVGDEGTLLTSPDGIAWSAQASTVGKRRKVDSSRGRQASRPLVYGCCGFA